MDFLAEYNFEIKYSPGRDYQVADYLSRNFVDSGDPSDGEEGFLTFNLDVSVESNCEGLEEYLV